MPPRHQYFRNVRALPISVLAKYWADELHLQSDIVLRELRLGFDGVPRYQEGVELQNPLIEDADLPPPNTPVNREWVHIFSEKQGWPFPRFWEEEPPEVQPVGRPSIKERIRDLFRHRKENHEEEQTISAEGRALHERLHTMAIDDHIPSPKTIEGHIRDLFNEQ